MTTKEKLDILKANNTKSKIETITTSNNPKTEDNIIIAFSIFAIAKLGTVITIKLIKKS